MAGEPTIAIDLSGDYNRAPTAEDRGSWTHEIVLEPGERTVRALSTYGDRAPARVAFNLCVSLVRIPDGTVDLGPIERFLRGHAGELAAVCDGYTVAWDGKRHVGRLTEAAGRVAADLQAGLELCRDRGLTRFSDPGERLAKVGDAQLFPADFGGDFDSLASDLSRDASRTGVHLDARDLARYLERRWERARAARRTAARS